jgi:hypothetical protein
MKNPFKPFLVADRGHIVCADWPTRQREYAEWIRFLILRRDQAWRDYIEHKLAARGLKINWGS